MKKTFTCITCPQGCLVTVEEKDGDLLVTGNKCKRGEKYAREEFTHPKRILTTTVRVRNGVIPLIPVRTRDGIPKERIFQCMRETANVIVDAPIKMGQVVVANLCDTGIDLIASRDVKPS
ncbi:MAG: DUF1667 domain-containing protein [Candidatus Helarchaeota archaeon]